MSIFSKKKELEREAELEKQRELEETERERLRIEEETAAAAQRLAEEETVRVIDGMQKEINEALRKADFISAKIKAEEIYKYNTETLKSDIVAQNISVFIAKLYWLGRGTSQYFDRALEWAGIAGEHGFKNAEGFKARILDTKRAVEDADQAEGKRNEALRKAEEEKSRVAEEELRPFLMAIADTHKVTDIGVAVTGRIQRGVVRSGDTVQIVGIGTDNNSQGDIVVGIEKDGIIVDIALAGDTVGIILKNSTMGGVRCGQIVSTPGSIRASKKFLARIRQLKTEDSGRHLPIMSGSRTQFFFRTASVAGRLNIEGKDKIMPGEEAEAYGELIVPVAMEIGTEFSITEMGNVIAVGIISGVL